MTRSIAKLFLAAAAAASLALTGCSAGMISQTADQVAAVPGASANLDAPGDDEGSVAVRDATFVYAGVAGYEAGADAPLQLRIFNDTEGPVTVTVNVDGAVAQSVTLIGGKAADTPSPTSSPSRSATASPQASPSPAAKDTPVKLTIPSGSYLALGKEAGQYLQVNGLKSPLNNASAIALVFSFTFGSTTQDMALVVPVAPPLDGAAPRTIAVVPSEATEGH